MLIKAKSVGITKWVLRLSQTKRTLLSHVSTALPVRQCSDAGGFQFKKYFTYGTQSSEAKYPNRKHPLGGSLATFSYVQSNDSYQLQSSSSKSVTPTGSSSHQNLLQCWRWYLGKNKRNFTMKFLRFYWNKVWKEDKYVSKRKNMFTFKSTMTTMVFPFSPMEKLNNSLHTGVFLTICKDLALGNVEEYFICLLC